MPRRFAPAPRQPGDWSAPEWRAAIVIFAIVAAVEVAICLACLRSI